MKYYPLSLKWALEAETLLHFVLETFQVQLCDGTTKLFSQTSTWELLNLKPETIFEIAQRLDDEFNISSACLSNILSK